MNQEIQKTNGGTITKSFGATAMQGRGETAAQAMAASATAAVQARYIVALQNPRSIDDFRARLLRDCQDPDFAEVAVYCRPVGKEKNEATGVWEMKYAKGPSIRMIEGAVRYFRNMHMECPIIYENDELMICRASAVDLESNIDWSTEFTIRKIYEKRGFQNKKTGEWEPPKGREIIGERVNSDGQPVYICVATEAENTLRMSAQRSKDLRTNVQRMLPKYVLDAAQAACEETMANRDAKSPDAAKNKLVDAFAQLSVMPLDLELYLGGKLDRLSPKDLGKLRGVYSTLKNGEMTWSEIMAVANPEGSTEQHAEVKERLLAEVKHTKTTPLAPKEVPAEPKSDVAPQVGDVNEPPADLKHLDEFPDTDSEWVWVKGVIYRFDPDNLNYHKHSERAFVAPKAEAPKARPAIGGRK